MRSLRERRDSGAEPVRVRSQGRTMQPLFAIPGLNHAGVAGAQPTREEPEGFSFDPPTFMTLIAQAGVAAQPMRGEPEGFPFGRPTFMTLVAQAGVARQPMRGKPEGGPLGPPLPFSIPKGWSPSAAERQSRKQRCLT
jgi:hypothetical protein